jgi:hypothetical protein
MHPIPAINWMYFRNVFFEISSQIQSKIISLSLYLSYISQSPAIVVNGSLALDAGEPMMNTAFFALAAAFG